jgi:glutathione-regulated potassium-efflux system ancillary protein KefC
LKIPVTILDSDPGQIELLRKFGTKTFYGDASRLDLLHAAGIEKAKLLVVAIDNMETAIQIIETVRQTYPHVQIVARARNRPYAFQMLNMNVTMVREVAASSVEMAAAVLEKLGHTKYESYRLTRQFYHYDDQLLRQAAPHADDEATLISLSKQSRDQLTQVMQDDRKKFHPSDE